MGSGGGPGNFLTAGPSGSMYWGDAGRVGGIRARETGPLGRTKVPDPGLFEKEPNNSSSSHQLPNSANVPAATASPRGPGQTTSQGSVPRQRRGSRGPGEQPTCPQLPTDREGGSRASRGLPALSRPGGTENICNPRISHQVAQCLAKLSCHQKPREGSSNLTTY